MQWLEHNLWNDENEFPPESRIISYMGYIMDNGIVKNGDSISNIKKIVYGKGIGRILMYFNRLLLFCKQLINHSPYITISGKTVQ